MKIDKLEVPDDYQETPEETEEDAKPQRNELIYIVGRVYRDERVKRKQPQWVYERYC